MSETYSLIKNEEEEFNTLQECQINCKGICIQLKNGSYKCQKPII